MAEDCDSASGAASSTMEAEVSALLARAVPGFSSAGKKAQNARALTQFIYLVHQFPQFLREISDFQFDRPIGEGGFGQVWLGNDLRTGKVVAIKELFRETLSARSS